MTRWIISIFAVGMCACTSAEFSTAEVDDEVGAAATADGQSLEETALGGDAGPTDVAQREVGGDAPSSDAVETADSTTSTDDALGVGDVVGDVAADTTSTACGAKVVCDDSNACTVDVCEPTTSTCRSDLVDKDADGFAPKSLGACGLDCNDSDPDAKPGQVKYFTVAHTGPTGAKSYDYDCNGVEEPSVTTVGACYYDDAGFCVFTAGFSITAPKCGETKQFVTSCTLSGESCTPGGSLITQGCR